jgi:diphthine-ammonia ligase
MNDYFMEDVRGKSLFCSWSGGKDSCLAFYYAVQRGGKPKYLLSMLTEDKCTSRSHGLPKFILEEQARRIGIPVVFRSATWDEYETTFIEALGEFKTRGIETGVFGDIDVESHREWCVRVCNTAGIRTCHPLWKRSRYELLKEFLELGFQATIIVTKADKLGPEFLGRVMNPDTIQQLIKAGIDPSGELGEYHTVVTDGPMFSTPILLKSQKRIMRGGYWFLELDGMPEIRKKKN